MGIFGKEDAYTVLKGLCLSMADAPESVGLIRYISIGFAYVTEDLLGKAKIVWKIMYVEQINIMITLKDAYVRTDVLD